MPSTPFEPGSHLELAEAREVAELGVHPEMADVSYRSLVGSLTCRWLFQPSADSVKILSQSIGRLPRGCCAMPRARLGRGWFTALERIWQCGVMVMPGMGLTQSP